MQAFELWSTFVGALLGTTVEDAEVKFDALAETERSAWEAVANAKPVSAPVVKFDAVAPALK